MKKLTQGKLAIKIGTSQAFISRLLNGVKHASFPTARRISEITGSDPIIWLNGGGTPNQRQATVRAWGSTLKDGDKHAATASQPRAEVIAATVS